MTLQSIGGSGAIVFLYEEHTCLKATSPLFWGVNSYTIEDCKKAGKQVSCLSGFRNSEFLMCDSRKMPRNVI